MKFIDLFAGIGGFRLGLERADKRFKCVYTSEWLERPRSIYRHHWGGKIDGQDIRLIRGAELPEADLIVGGFPCATFSVAGKRAGFCLDDTRGTLCFEMFRLASERGIPYILFENVKGLLNHDSGKTFTVILSALDEMGYDAQWELLDSQHFTIPQHRERIFLIASIRGKPFPKVFPIGKTDETDAGGRQETQGEREGVREQDNNSIKAGTLMHRLYGGNTNNQYIDETRLTQWRRGHFRDYKAEGTPTLTANMGTGGHNVPFIYPPHNKCCSKKAYTLGQNPQCPSAKAGQIVNGLRKLTPKECERLQGLPDDFTKWMVMDDGTKKENSMGDRYERCGRTVTIPVIEAIGKKLIGVMDV